MIDNLVDKTVCSIFILLAIGMLVVLIMLPFAIMQDYRMKEAEIEYIKRSKHNIELEVKDVR